MNEKNFPVLTHVLIWLAIVLIVIIDSYFDGEPMTLFFIRISIGILIFYINYLYLLPRFFFRKKVLLYFISAFILVFLSGTLLNQIESYEYFTEIVRWYKENDEDHVPKEISYVVYALLIFSGMVIRTYNEWSKNEIAKQEIESKKNISELEALKNQINPHFLFNSLNSICSLAVKKSDQTPEAIIMLSELMRYMLYETKDNLVLLEKEIAYIENYVNLQRLRLANEEGVSLNINGDINSQKIPPLLLISFIENAFKYGVDESGHTNVSIEIDVNQDSLRFNCQNYIGKKQEDAENSGIGLQNTKKRLELLYPNKHKLSIKEDPKTFNVDLFLKLD